MSKILQHIQPVAIFGSNENILDENNTLPVSNPSQPPADFVYQYLELASGPTGTFTYDLNTNSAGTPSLFEYEVPANKVFKWSRINFVLVDGSISPGDFGGIAAGLATGCRLQTLDADNSVLKNLDGGVPIQTNADFAPLAGTDVPISELVGDDLLPIRFSVFKAGANMKLTAGQKIRWTNQDDLSAITKFRAMVQGILEDA